MKSKNLIIAIDGPAGAGKSTISKLVANELEIEYIDTGAMFRAITYKILKNNININNKVAINELLDSTTIDFHNGKIYLDNKDVSEKIRSTSISLASSNIAKNKDIRNKLLYIQRGIANKKSLVMDGRDIGTVVLPYANYKFYLTASVEVRALRRYNDLSKVADIDYESVKNDIIKRDNNDITRELAPLKKAEDAILIDSSQLNIEQTVKKIISYIDRG